MRWRSVHTPRLGFWRACIALALAGPWIYVAAVLVGGALWPGYSQYAESISTLTSAGAPNQWILQPAFLAYNLSVLALAFAVYISAGTRRTGRLGATFLAGAGLSGIVMAAFPQGPWSAPLSGTGVEHTIIAGVDALCFLLALAFLATRFSQEPNWKFESRVTGVFLVAGVVFGGFGAMSVTAPYAGLAERLSIGTFLVWSEWVAIALNRRFTETAPAVAPSGGAAAVAS